LFFATAIKPFILLFLVFLADHEVHLVSYHRQRSQVRLKFRVIN